MNGPPLTRDRGHELLRRMLLLRRFEERCAELYSEQRIRGFLHLYVGEEAVAVGAMAAISDDEPVVATYREHGHALLRGIPAGAVMAEMFGKANGCARGRGGSMHLFSAERKFQGGFAIVGGGLPIAAGLALADSMRGQRRATVCFFGDGATDEGIFHETLNLVALWNLPVLFLCENNLYAMGTALVRHRADPDISHQPAAYGIPAERVDGMDVLSVEEATRRAIDAVRRGDGPRFLELRTYRFRAHSMYDPDRYRPRDEIERWKERDPIKLFSELLRTQGLLEESELARLTRGVEAEVAAAVQFAEAGPLEPVDDLSRDVYTRERS